MTIIQAFILGLVQGLTEFLPVSSSGHLLLTRNIFGLTGDYIFFDIMLHVGTLLSIVVMMKKELLSLFKPPFGQAILIAIASIPAVIVGFGMRDVIGVVFDDAKYLCFFFATTAVLLFLTQWLSSKSKESSRGVDLKTAIYMGLAQGVAVFPGVSRSGTTIAGGVVGGARREAIAKFCFLMSIPIILGSALIEGLDSNVMQNIDAYNLLVGGVASFVSGLVAIKLMLKLIAKANYKWFGLYLLALSVVTFVVYFL